MRTVSRCLQWLSVRKDSTRTIFALKCCAVFFVGLFKGYTVSKFLPNLYAQIITIVIEPCLIFLYIVIKRKGATRLFRPAGWDLRRFAELCFSKKTYTQVLEPALSDMQKEHFDALAAGRPWHARMALARGYWAFWSAVVAQLPISLFRRIYEVWKVTKTGS